MAPISKSRKKAPSATTPRRARARVTSTAFQDALSSLVDLGQRLTNGQADDEDVQFASDIVARAERRQEVQFEEMWKQRQAELSGKLTALYRRYRGKARRPVPLEDAVVALFKGYGLTLYPRDLRLLVDMAEVRRRGGPVDGAAKAIEDVLNVSSRSIYNWNKLAAAPRFSQQALRVRELCRLRFVLELLRANSELSARTVHDDLLEAVDVELARRQELLGAEAPDAPPRVPTH